MAFSTTEETIFQEFSRFKPGSVERVKKLTDYAFVHYRSRSDAITALSVMNGAQIDGATVEVALAKPPGFKDGNMAGRKCYNNRGNPVNAAGRGNGTSGLHRNEGGPVDTCMNTMSLLPPARSPCYLGGAAGKQAG